MRHTTFRLQEHVKGSQVDRSKTVKTFEHVSANDRVGLNVKGMNLAQIMFEATCNANENAEKIARHFFSGCESITDTVYDGIRANESHIIRIHEMDSSNYTKDRVGVVSNYTTDLEVVFHAQIVGNVYSDKDKSPKVRALVIETWIDNDTDRAKWIVKCDKYEHVSVRSWGFAATYNAFITDPLSVRGEHLSANFRKMHGTTATYKYRLERVADGIATSGTAN